MPHGEELDAVTFYKTLYAKMDQLGMARKFTSRAVNEGFSGGEKKRNEVLQMLLLDPLYAILDETDSGLIAGNTIRAVLEAAGVRDIVAKSLGSSNHANVVKATLQALASLRTSDQVLADRGKKKEKAI